MRLKSFDGTATELAALLEEHTGEKLLPSVLSKRLVRYASELDRVGIQISTSHTRDSRQLHILCIDGTAMTGMTGKMRQAPCQISCHSRHSCHQRYEVYFCPRDNMHSKNYVGQAVQPWRQFLKALI